MTFAPGTVEQTISIPVLFDSVIETPEAFTVTLSAAVNATLDNSSATVTITDAAEIPTLSEWMLMLLAVACAACAIRLIRP